MARVSSTNTGGEECIRYSWESQKRPLERPRSMWVDNIKMDLGQIGCSRMD
jgi:hypothetical protein